jgi:cytochrome c oxidase subunit 1
MSAVAAPAATAGAHAHTGANYLTAEKGLWSWLTTVDHKRIAVMYLISVCTAFLVGGLFALGIRSELMFPNGAKASTFLPAIGSLQASDVYNQVFTVHGAVMVFMFVIPGIPAVIGNFALPIMIGAKDVAFPRLNLASWYCWLAGSILMVSALFFGGIDTGWTFYTPYSTETTTNVIPVALGAFVLGFSSILTGLNFIVTIHKLRMKGLGWYNMPLMLWGLYATAVIQILATPVVGITLVLLIFERLLGIGIFDPKLGGDPLLFQHFFWFYSHPAVYIMILPAMGVASELISIFSRKHIFGYKFIAWSSVSIALVGFLVWGHHMFTSGQSNLASVVFSALTSLIAIPSAVKVFNWLTTMWRGEIHLTTPMLYALSFIWMFTIGGLTGLFLSTLSTDIHLHDTYFVVAHFHYVMVGSMMMAFLGAVHHWWPKMFGIMYHEGLSKLFWAFVFVGFNVTFFPQFIMGAQGMPRRYFDYIDAYAPFHFISSIGSYIMAVGLFGVLYVWIKSFIDKVPAPENPWGARSLEWQTTSPPPVENFSRPVKVSDFYDFNAVEYNPSTGNWDEKKDYVPAPAH